MSLDRDEYDWISTSLIFFCSMVIIGIQLLDYYRTKSDIQALDFKCPECPKPVCPQCPSVSNDASCMPTM